METTTNFQSLDSGQRTQQFRITDWTWEGATVTEITGTVADLFPQIPVFSRHPFRSGGEENRFKDEIRREPLRISDDPLPVATVGKTYSLIQHRDVLASVFKVLRLIRIDISAVESSLLLSEYGERMQWSCKVPNYDFDPGDHNPLVLRINCLNSVDSSTALEITFSWFRLVCSNGMTFGVKESHLRRRHIASLDPVDVADYLNSQLARADDEKSLYREWYKTPVDLSALAKWIDHKVAHEWGPHAAARAWHIVTRGVDGEIQQSAKCLPHDLGMVESSERLVPGCDSPVSSLFDVSQALSWIAQTRNTIPEQLAYVKAIPALMEPLTKPGQNTERN